jgi:hypothetical protein
MQVGQDRHNTWQLVQALNACAGCLGKYLQQMAGIQWLRVREGA